MKIVFLSRYQHVVERGAENFVAEISKRLSSSHQVKILAGLEADNLSLLQDGGYDIVIPINGRLQSFKASLGRTFGKYKLLITGHSGVGRDDIFNIAICKPDVFVALTDYMADWAKKWAWGSQVVKIPNGIDLKKFNPEGQKIDLKLKRPIILSVGALVWYKHHEKLIQAMLYLKEGSLLIVGEGERKKELDKLGKELLGDRFGIMDFNYEEMPKVYRSCDLFSLPSWEREAFGLVYLEAMASGLGVVAPCDLSRKEIIHQAGVLVNPDQIEEYSQAIKKALGINWSKKARAQAEKFSWDKIARKYEILIEDIILKE